MIDFGLVDALDAEAVGVPGQRTFRMRANKGESYAALWLEKEQLSRLGQSFSQLLADYSAERGRPVSAVTEMGPFPSSPEVDLQVAGLGIDFDQESEHVVLLVSGPDSEELGEPSFRMEFNRAQALSLIRTIQHIVASGRPLCPLCQRVLESDGSCPGCPASNGHAQEMPLPPLPMDD